MRNFHSVEVTSRAMHQTLAYDKSWPTIQPTCYRAGLSWPCRRPYRCTTMPPFAGATSCSACWGPVSDRACTWGSSRALSSFASPNAMGWSSGCMGCGTRSSGINVVYAASPKCSAPSRAFGRGMSPTRPGRRHPGRRVIGYLRRRKPPPCPKPCRSRRAAFISCVGLPLMARSGCSKNCGVSRHAWRGTTSGPPW